MIDNSNYSVGKCNNTTWSEQKHYTNYGVMTDIEDKCFPTGELNEDFDRVRVDSMLYVPRQAFEPGFWYDKYENRTLLTREKLDTARIVFVDKKSEIEYNATTLLNQEKGLRDIVQKGSNTYGQDIVIQPLSKEKIEAMIQRKSNPKVAEGLRQFAVGRETYYYNSAEDNNFVCKGISQSQGMSR